MKVVKAQKENEEKKEVWVLQSVFKCSSHMFVARASGEEVYAGADRPNERARGGRGGKGDTARP